MKLKPEDIDAGRRLIYVRGGKGRKDRYTLLSDVAMETLRHYLDKYKPVKWLFPGARKEKHISTRTIQAIFEHAREKTGIEKDVTVHTLRHSFATHLLERGTDLIYNLALLCLPLVTSNGKTSRVNRVKGNDLAFLCSYNYKTGDESKRAKVNG